MSDSAPCAAAEMEEAARRALTNVRDSEAMKEACQGMDKLREEIKKKHGVLDIGVSAIREVRDE